MVFTAADIRNYGWTTLADVLRAAPGMHVRSDRFYDYVGTRGFTRVGDFNARTLSLLLAQHHLYVEHMWTHAQPFLQRQRDVQSRAKRGFGLHVVDKILNGRWRPGLAPDSSAGKFVLTVLARKTAAAQPRD